jgi:hypothetical protein
MTDYLAHCSRCDQDKPESEFSFEARRGIQPWCRPCKTEYTRERRRLRRENPRALPPVGSGITQAEWQDIAEPERQRIRDMYGMTD